MSGERGTSVAAMLRDARSWLDEHATRRNGLADREFSVLEARRWQARLYERGLIAPDFPTEHGGGGLPEAFARQVEELLHEYELPFEFFGIGLGMCAPTLLALGTDEQKRRYLPSLLRGEEIWCQLFSEPGAGSDVASLQTRAIRTESGWRVDGQKVWSSGAHHSDFGLLLARTDPDVPKHRGLTMFILDMRSPGVVVRPLRQMTGRSRFNEVFLTDVELGGDDVVGGLNKGWAAAVSTLNFERVSVSGWGWNRSARLTSDHLRGRVTGRGIPLSQGDKRRLAQLYASQCMVENLIRLHKEEADAGCFTPARGSVTKVAESRHKELCLETACAVAGFDLIAEPEQAADAGRLLADVLAIPGSAIAGGTDEVQRNIIGERILGLPADIRIDKHVPFRDLIVGTTTAPSERDDSAAARQSRA